MENTANLIRRVARGKHGSENLSQTEARELFTQLLEKEADPLQLGAFLIAQRMKGETPEEIAGFVEAAQNHVTHFGKPIIPESAVDLPCYAGKRRASPAYLAAALKARDHGIPIVIHGTHHIEGRISAWDLLQHYGVKRADDIEQGASILNTEGIVYLDLETLCPALFNILALRSRLGVRSFANTVVRLLNPLQCSGQLNGFFHTPYGSLMGQANNLLNQPGSLLFMGAEGEPELYASRQKKIVFQQNGKLSSLQYPDASDMLYPKTGTDLADLHDQFGNLHHKNIMTEREKVVLQRMQEAFHIAVHGTLPATWSQSELCD